MKNIYLLLAIIIICAAKLTAQITLNSSYGHPGNSVQTSRIFIDKFHLSGYKYVQTDNVGLAINIYNLNQTLFKSIAIPSSIPLSTGGIYYVSEHLFDLDNGVEYVIQTFGPHKVWVVDETGTIILSRDSASIANVFPQAFESSGVYFDGVATKMMLNIGVGATVYKHEIYDLPGTIPCLECTNGIVTSIAGNLNTDVPSESAIFYPNPVTDQLKLKYTLPKNSKNAHIKIFDSQGKMVEDFKITSTFDFIYLPTNYNNGLYFYSLIVDDKVIKSEKIILNK